MRRAGRVVVGVLTVVVAALLARPAAAQQGSIKGRVLEAAAAGNGAANVAVSIDDAGLRTTTDATGNYEFRRVPPGTHTVRVRGIGFAPTSARLRLAPGEALTHDFTLERSVVALAPVEVVVGSRARHTAAEELAVPVDVYSAEQIRRQGTSETSQVLQQLAPSVNFPRQSVTDADDIVRPFTLRGLSPDHTLVLVNGLRRHRTALVHIFAYGMGAGSSGVDLNALPSSAIDRMEVLRDGAAAQYGSDAIAGVVNVVLKEGRFGPTLNTDVGRYNPGHGYPADGTTYNLSGGWGIPIGRGSLSLSGEYRHREPTNRAGADNSDQIVPGDADITDPVTGALLKKNNPVAMPNHHWGDGLEKDAIGFGNLRLPLNAAATHEVYAFGGYSFRHGEGQGFRRQGISDRNWPEIFPQGYLPTFAPDVRDGSAAAGVRGAVSGWNYDVGASYGYNIFDYNLHNTMNVSLGPCLGTPCAPGLDGVLGTADDPGIPNRTDIFAGRLRSRELSTGVNAAKGFDVGLAGPLSIAAGASYRHESYRIYQGEPASYVQGGHLNRDSTAAPPGSQVFAGFQPSNEADAGRNNVGTYLDLEAPVSNTVLANIAGRFEHYSDFGSRVTGKLALRFQPTKRLVLRGAISTGFRAPNLAQNFYASSVTNFELDTVTGRQRPLEVGIFPTSSRPAQLLGARPLRDEISRNISAGFAFSPTPQATLTFDYFHIRIDHRIILTSNIASDSITSILRNAGLFVQAAQYFTNALDTKTQGVDFTGNYRFLLPNAAQLEFTAGVNWTQNKVLRINEPPELAGTGAVLFDSIASGGLISLERERPSWRGTLTAEYNATSLHALVRSLYWGKFTSAQIGACGACVQTYGAKVLFDTEVGYRFPYFDLSIGVRNLFNTFPDRPSTDNSFGIMVWPAASPFGYNGRFLYARTQVQLGR